MFYPKLRFEQHPHTHPCAHKQIQVWLLAFCCSCQLCLLYMYNTVSPIHVEGMPVTGGCRGASYLPNSLTYKKVLQTAVCEQSKSEKLRILCIFGQRNSLKFRKGSSFVRFAPSVAKKKKLQNFCKNAHIQKIRKRSTFEKFAPSSDKNPWCGLGWSQSNA